MKLNKKIYFIFCFLFCASFLSNFVFAAGDVTPPSITTLSPADDSSDWCGSSVVFSFDEAIVVGAGNIVIYKGSDDSVFDTIDAVNTDIGNLNTQVTADLNNDFVTNTDYYIQIDAGAFQDTSANPFAGILDNTTWNFTTEDCDPPIVTSLSPTDDSNSVALDSNLVIVFNETVLIYDGFAPGIIDLRRLADDSLVEQFLDDSGLISGGGNTITINPTADFEADTEYYVEISNDFFKDSSIAANLFAGISGNSTWNFDTTVPPPPSGGGGGGSPHYICDDELDNDGDGLVDYPEDPGCDDAKDKDEYNEITPVVTYACSDEIDNDNDGLIDMNDPGCENPEDQDEFNQVTPPPPPQETCATNPTLCPPPQDPCITNPSLCTPPPPIDPCITNPSSCLPPPPIDPCLTDPSLCAPVETCATNPALCIYEEPANPIVVDEYPVIETNPGRCENPTTILGIVWCTVIDTYEYTVDTFSVAFEQMKSIATSSPGDIILKLIGIVGILFGAIFSVLPRLFGTPLSFTEIWMLPYRLWSAVVGVFGLKRRARPWGTVYDSVTKQPLDPVIVSLQDMEGKEIQSSITDMDGRYGFLVPPGKYRLLPKKTHYSFPSLKLVGKTRDELYLDLYFGDVFEVKSEGDVITKNIPMDPIGFDWNEFAKRDQKLMKFYSKRDVLLTKISDAVFSFGFTVSSIALVSAPSFYNIFIFCLYLVLLFLRETGIKTKKFGRVLDTDENPISFAIIKVFDTKTDTMISKKVANKYGQYFCLIQQGNYSVEVWKKLDDESYQQVLKSGEIDASKGYINETFKIDLK